MRRIRRKAGLSGLFCFGALGLVLSGATVAPAAAEPLLLEVTRALPGFDQRTKEPIVLYRLSEPSKRLLAQFTSENVGRPVDLRINGKVIMQPVIREPILGGSGQLSGNLTIEDADRIAKQLSAGTRIEIELTKLKE